MNFFKKKPVAEAVKTPEPKQRSYTVLLENFRANQLMKALEKNQFARYDPPPNVVTKEQNNVSMACDSMNDYAWINAQQYNYSMDFSFKGYPILAQMATRPEIRKIVTIIAEEMTRKWIEFVAVGDTDVSEKITQIEKEFERLKVREAFRKMAEHDGYFGRGHIYYDLEMPSGSGRVYDERDELKTKLVLSPAKIRKGSLKGLTVIEPMWCYPGVYNSDNPLRPDFYVPREWFVFQKDVDESRLITMISNPVPEMLKAAFAFGGISMSQLVEAYVNNWISTRDSVKDSVRAYSTSGFKTNLQSTLQGGDGMDLFSRVDLFNNMRDNQGSMVLDKSEEFFQFNAPLSTLDSLQGQSQEQMAGIAGIPVVKLWSITPSGLNTSTDGEIRSFYDTIHARQEADFRDPLNKLLKIVQLSLFGEIDDDISFNFIPLYQLSELEQSQVELNEANTDAAYVTIGALDGSEVRKRLSSDKNSPYDGLKIEPFLVNDDEEDPESNAQ